jgi:hypothetical protein
MTDHKLDFRLSAQDRRGPIFVRSEGPAAGDVHEREARRQTCRGRSRAPARA